MNFLSASRPAKGAIQLHSLPLTQLLLLHTEGEHHMVEERQLHGIAQAVTALPHSMSGVGSQPPSLCPGHAPAATSPAANKYSSTPAQCSSSASPVPSSSSPGSARSNSFRTTSANKQVDLCCCSPWYRHTSWASLPWRCWPEPSRRRQRTRLRRRRFTVRSRLLGQEPRQ